MTYKAFFGPLLTALLINSATAQSEAEAGSGAEPTSENALVVPVAEPPIVIDSESNSYDLRTGVSEFSDNVNIERGPMTISADRGMIRQVDGEMTEIELFGNPTRWQDQLEDGSVVNGEANNIYFDVIANVVTLTGDAIIRHEQGEFTGDRLVYDLNSESLSGSSDGDNRVRVVIEPGALPEDG